MWIDEEEAMPLDALTLLKVVLSVVVAVRLTDSLVEVAFVVVGKTVVVTVTTAAPPPFAALRF